MRLIDLNHLLELVKKNTPFIYSILAPIAMLCPTIEAEPVRHATYDEGGDCTNCGYPMPTDDRFDAISPDEIKYCYNCGAKMDAKEEAACD